MDITERRSSRKAVPAFVVAVLAAAALLASAAGTASADPAPPPTGEGPDQAIVSPDAERQLARAGVAPEAGALAAAGPVIEDFHLDSIPQEGRAADICFGRLRNGTAWTYSEVTQRFGGSPGTLYACRERWAVHEDPECDGTVVDPRSDPDFVSECWSNHAQGRAFDVMVGRAGSGWNTYRGNAIVNWLLATDADGNQNAMARRLGVQQLLWNNRCWNSDGDRGIAKASRMRVCGYGHYDHVHVDLTIRGARGRMAYWGRAARPPQPKVNGLYETNVRRKTWRTRAFTNLRPGRASAGRFTTSYERTIGGDWDGDGARDDMLLWSTDDGRWRVRAWSGGRRPIVAKGRWATHLDGAYAADLDRNGRFDDLLLWDRETGSWEAQHWSAFTPTVRQTGSFGPEWQRLVVGDWDSDGVIDETFAWDPASGRWIVHSWSGHQPSTRSSGRWSVGWDDVVAGDWDAQGNFDEMFLWDRETGRWEVLMWSRGGASVEADGRWARRWDRFFAGDFDTDGRIDDMYLRDDATGRWHIVSWHRFEPRRTLTGTGSPRPRQYVVGTWGTR